VLRYAAHTPLTGGARAKRKQVANTMRPVHEGGMMAQKPGNKFAAAEPGLGYLYQFRYALYAALSYPEATRLCVEADDDIDLTTTGHKDLASLKHKAEGERLTNLAADFWKSVRIWLDRYKRDGKVISALRFLLITTNEISPGSELRHLAEDARRPDTLAGDLMAIVAASDAAVPKQVHSELVQFSDDEREDFFGRIVIIDSAERIGDLPTSIIERHLRTVPRKHRADVFERLEGWWMEQVIRLLTGKRTEPIASAEVSDRLAGIADEYKSDNLPITFAAHQLEEDLEAASHSRMFVQQLRAINASDRQIQFAILDYYRAFEQRSEWVRKDLLLSDELECYEERLVDEWARFREMVCQDLEPEAAEGALQKAGRSIFNWAQETESVFHVRARVTQPFVHRGSFHMLANEHPQPRVHWHPLFLERIAAALEVAK
jgi:hypothetical protein